MILTRLLLRRHRVTLGAWLLLLIGLCGGTAQAYPNTYPTEEQRHAAVVAAQHNPATTLLYGVLPGPGTPAQLFAWEAGAIAAILTAVFAVILTVSLTRALEEDGTLEFLRGAETPLRSASTLLAGVSVVLGLGCGAVVSLTFGVAGAMALGAALGLTFLLVAAVTAVIGQVASSAGQARVLSFAVVGVALALRDPLPWIAPRAAIAPFTADRWWVLAPALLIVAVLVVAASAIARRREFGAGLIPRHDRRDLRLRVRTPAGLAFRLGRSSLLGWTITVTAVGTLLSAMGSGAVEQSREGDIGGFLGSQFGAGDAAAAYLSFCDTIVGIAVCAYAVLSMLAARRSESDGLTDLILTTGRRRWSPPAAQFLVTAAGSLLILLTTGALGALTTPAAISGDDIGLRAFAYAVGQWPAAVATAGCAALLIGLVPRLSGLAWLPVAFSALMALLGKLLGVPGWLQDLGFLRHVPDFAAPSPPVGALLLLVALGAVLSLAGLAVAERRDVIAG
jgi:ABC-2 type transport system permease protein